jgi:hypothetical protein
MLFWILIPLQENALTTALLQDVQVCLLRQRAVVEILATHLSGYLPVNTTRSKYSQFIKHNISIIVSFTLSILIFGLRPGSHPLIYVTAGLLIGIGGWQIHVHKNPAAQRAVETKNSSN